MNGGAATTSGRGGAGAGRDHGSSLRAAAQLGVVLSVLGFAPRAAAWAGNEHVRITFLALSPAPLTTKGTSPPLDDDCMEKLGWLWATARGADRSRADLCPDLRADELSRGRRPTCLSFASLPALAGDHACSPGELGASITDGDRWELAALRKDFEFDRAVQRINARRDDEEERLAEIQNRRRDTDVEVLGVDGRYYARAMRNRPHFQLPRSSRARTLADYLDEVLRPGARLNATALYVAYHVAALRSATSARRRAAAGDAEAAAAHAWDALLHEVAALHFLEDSFATGHLVGGVSDWHSDAVRMGTHDFYSAHGYSLTTWEGSWYSGRGDAFATERDYVHAATAVRESLRQLARALGATRGLAPPERDALALDLEALSRVRAGGGLDSCADRAVPRGLLPAGHSPLVDAVLLHTPAPAAADPPPPTFANEYGGFLLAGASIHGAVPFYVSDHEGDRAGLTGDVSGTFGGGLGMEGVMSSQRDGVILGGVTASMQLRAGTSLFGVGPTLRLPFAWVPGDFLVWGLPALLGSETSAPSWAVKGAAKASHAASFLPLGFLPPIAHRFSDRTTFKFEVGREVTLQLLFDTEASWAYRGWELSIPYATLRTHGFDRNIASDDVFGLVLRVGCDRQLGTFIGPALVYAHSFRWYPGD